jgi:low affinity Fe/Cu permease
MNADAKPALYKLNAAFDHFSNWVTQITGSPQAFIIAVFMVVAWLIWGVISGFSDRWEMVMDTGTMVVTLLMMFVIQQSQNKDTMTLHLKLNELILANEKISNRLALSEDKDMQEIVELKKTINEEMVNAEQQLERKNKSE